MNARLSLWVLLLWALPVSATEGRVDVARFSLGELEPWQARLFSGETRYRIERLDGRQVLRADSDGTASGLYREIRVDLAQTPILNWSWRVDNVLQNSDERVRAGDDYPARVYVVFSGGVRFWRTRAINYVWSSHQAVGAEWPNAYAGNARMVAVASGERGVGEWQTLRRDVRADYRRLFGTEPPRTVDAVAIMTDTDDTGQRATAWYGDIWFSAD